MNWDITMPGALGSFAAMMFNANNVAAEASPVTTVLEIDVGKALCEMLGFGGLGAPTPWGHITCDGSIANAESMWSARNLRYHAAALARAIRLEDDMEDACDLSVKCADGRFAKLLDLEPWDLVNLPNDVILDLPRRLIDDAGLKTEVVQRAIETYGIQSRGAVDFHGHVLQGLKPGIIIAPATAHYSWDKAAAILGLGKSALRHVPVDLEARADIPHLRRILDECIRTETPVIQVVAVAGSTAESAVDPIDAIAGLREEYATKGLTFALHADAAWGGYFRSMLQAPKGKDTMTPVDPLSKHVETQLRTIHACDTITLDPHKSGYLPYPAGSLCYRDQRMMHLIAHASPVVYHGGDVPMVGVYGIEGSKPGAAAAGVALSHTIIPLDRSGYGMLLGRCIFNAKRFYAGVVTLAQSGDPFLVVPVKRLPAEREGRSEAEVEAERQLLRETLKIENDELKTRMDRDPALKSLFEELGPDLTVFPYAFNFILPDGTVNTDPEKMNLLNERIFGKLSIEKIETEDATPDVDMIVTSTLFPRATYGDTLIGDVCARARVDPPKTALRVLISTMQDPWVTDNTDGTYIPKLMGYLRKTVLKVCEGLVKEKG